MSVPDSHILERICVDGICHCDWRLTILDCAERTPMMIVHGINVGISSIAVLLGIGIIINRVGMKGHSFFDINSTKGFLRPKPIDALILFLVIFNFLRLLCSAFIIGDVRPDLVSRSFLFEFGWQFGFGACALYLIGIAQTLADSHKVISNSWLPSAKLVDLIGGTIFFAPFIINNCFSLAAGILGRSNLPLAETFIRLLYVFWFIHCFSLAMAVLFSGFRLVKVLETHLSKFSSSGPRYASVKAGIFKIKALLSIITIALFMFAAFLLLFGILRALILVNTPGSVFLGAVWNFLGPVATVIAEFAIIFNPKVDDSTTLGLKTSSNEKSTNGKVTYTNFSVNEYSSTKANEVSFQGTLSHNAFDDLKHKHGLDDDTVNAYPPQMGELKVTELGIPMQDYEYENNYSSNIEPRKSSSIDNDNISQADLVGHAARQ